MTIKNYLPMEEKPPEAIGRGPTASRYQECAAHPFLLPCSLQEVLLLLATCTMRISTARFIVGISCHPVIPTPTTGFNKAALVSSMTYTPTHDCPSIVNQFTATTVTTAVPLLVLLQHLQTLQMMLPCTLFFLVPSLSSAISLPPLLLYTAATPLLIVINLPLGNSTMLWTAVQRLPAHQILNITTTTSTTSTSIVHQFMAISMYGSCLSLPADDHRVILVSLIPSTLRSFANKHQHHTFKITPTAACSFIVILDPETCLLPSIPDYLHHKITALTPAIQYIFTQVGLYLLILLAHQYAFCHVYFLHVYCLHATLKIHDNICQPQLAVVLLPPVAACADSYSTPSSNSDGALAILDQPSCNKWKQAPTTTSHASLHMSSLTGSLILALL
jgi:hypothetical protein